MGAESLAIGFIASSALSATGKLIQGASNLSSAYAQQREYALQNQQLEFKKRILEQQYRDKKTELSGAAITRAAANGIKISGTVAQSISASIAELSLEESLQKYNISAQQLNNTYMGRQVVGNARAEMAGAVLNAAITAVGSYFTYRNAFGTPTTQTTGVNTATKSIVNVDVSKPLVNTSSLASSSAFGGTNILGSFSTTVDNVSSNILGGFSTFGGVTGGR